jgi:hypothetical protein
MEAAAVGAINRKNKWSNTTCMSPMIAYPVDLLFPRFEKHGNLVRITRMTKESIAGWRYGSGQAAPEHLSPLDSDRRVDSSIPPLFEVADGRTSLRHYMVTFFYPVKCTCVI